jgi:hypothetical protein
MNTLIADHFTAHDLLTPAECEEIRARIDALHLKWIRHHDDVPLHTLGISGFLTHSRQEYETRATEKNAVLRAHFADVLALVRAALERHVGAPVEDHPIGALPGFNVFGSHPYFATPFASAHFDVQHRNLNWPERIDETDVVSFTLPVALPATGGGIDIWDIRAPDIANLDRELKPARIAAAHHEHLPHRTGTIVIHRGDILHRIAPTTEVQPDDRRYTLQGHTVRVGTRYIWYW